MDRKALLLTAAFIAATPGFVSASDLARAKPETAAATVVLAGLDLSTADGIAQAHKRLSRTAQRLCRTFRDDRKVSDRETYADCVHDTVTIALEQIQMQTSSVARN
jgi:UrcA family protein